MYVIIVYDVSVERINKIRKFLKQYLIWRQNSVFEGEITKSQLEKIKIYIKKIIKDNDNILIYTVPSIKNIDIIKLGNVNDFSNIL